MGNELAKFARKFWIHILLFMVSILIYSSITLAPTHADERFYYMGAINIIEKHKFLIDNFPPIIPMGFPLLMAPFLLLFGKNAQSAVLPSLILGALTIVLVYDLAKRLIDKKAAIFAALFMLFSNHWLMSVLPMSDVPALFFIVLSLSAFIKYLLTEKPSYLYLFYFTTGIACLIRLAAGLIFIISGLSLLVMKKFYLLKKKELWLGIFVFLIIYSPQLIHNTVYHGSPVTTGYDFWASKGRTHTPDLWSLKYLVTSTYMRPAFGLNYIIRLLNGFGTPILPFFLFGIWSLVKQRKRKELALFVPWIVAPILVFSFYFQHDIRFVIPSLPALFIVSGYGFTSMYQLSLIKNQRIRKIIMAILLIMLLIPTAIFRYERLQKREVHYKSRKQALSWIEKNIEPNTNILSLWTWYEQYYTPQRKLIQIIDPEEKLERFIAQPKKAYFVIFSDANLDFRKRFLEVKNWLNEKYGLHLLQSSESKMKFSLQTKLLHKVLSTVGYYSLEEKLAREGDVEFWEAYLITKNI